MNLRRLAARAAVFALAAAPAMAQGPSFGGGGGGGANLTPREIGNAIGNFIISEVGMAASFVALLLAALYAIFGAAGGGGGGGRGVGATVLWIAFFWCVGTILAVVTGGANFGGGSGFFA